MCKRGKKGKETGKYTYTVKEGPRMWRGKNKFERQPTHEG
jgi:hypothetical protein